MSRKLVTFGLVCIDIAIFSITPFVALWLRLDGSFQSPYYPVLLSILPITVTIRIGVFYAFGLYRRLWRYASIPELLVISGTITLSSVIIVLLMVAGGWTIPRSVHVISWLLSTLLVGSSRLFIRVLSYIRQKNCNPATNTLIVGAGDAGAMIAREIGQRYYDSKRLVGFIDDDPYKENQMLFGTRVLGNRNDIAKIVKQHGVNEIIIAMPSVTGSILRQIVRECKLTHVKVKIVPGIYELIDGKVSVSQLRDVDLEDLLRRDPVQLNMSEICGYLSGKRVLVTGAGGSIGSELCRQIGKLAPVMLILLGKGENSIYEIHQELIEVCPELTIHPIIADVRDTARINEVFSAYKPQVVFHAAAHKHVPLMEMQPQEAVRNNIFGTKTVAEAADKYKVETLIMISTDKAVNPTSVMGATKRVAELIIQNLNTKSNTCYAAVRFGNVLGSRGSVIPLFKKQIAQGGPITITDPEMKRYFMTIPEASQLVLQAGALAHGGEVFVLDMGEPVKILDMACDLIELSGLRPHRDIEIKYSGLRPGEKLFEELLTAEEGTKATKHEKIFVANLNPVSDARLARLLLQLEDNNLGNEAVKGLLHEMVLTYTPYKHQDQNVLHKDSARAREWDVLRPISPSSPKIAIISK